MKQVSHPEQYFGTGQGFPIEREHQPHPKVSSKGKELVTGARKVERKVKAKEK